MTVSSSTNRASYSGNGSLTTFAYGFKVFDQDDLTVILRASNGTETVQTITTDYTVTGVGDVGGGNVVFGTAPASGVTVVILREMDLEQGLDLVPNDPFPAQSLEDSLDKLTFMVQQHDEQLGRAIKASRTNVITGSEFVISAADRANKVFAFDSSGDVSITQEIGTFRGDWAASTAYVERDLVKDTTTNDVFIVNSAHTSSGSLPLTTNTNSAKYEKIIDISNPPGDLTVGGNISTSGSVTAGSFVIGSADINENDLEAIDSIIAGTVAASKAVVVDVNKDISSFRNLTATGDITFGGLSDGTITVTDILDEDDLTSNSATSLATQQSIKAYVDSQVGSFDTLAEVLANGNTTGGTNLSVSTGDNIKFADSSQAIFGAGDDLRINHNGSYSYISDLGQGPLFIGGNDEVSIMNGQLNEYKIKAETNGAVTLYYDNAVKMATTTLGIDVTGTITFDGGETTADFYFGDNDKAIFGAGSDLQIYHDSASGQSIIHENGPSVLKIRATDFRISNAANTADYLSANNGAEVSIRYNGAVKLATTNTGVDITGTLTSDGLTVDGAAAINGANFSLDNAYYLAFRNAANTLDITTLTFDANDQVVIDPNQYGTVIGTSANPSLKVAGNRDISFYEDTGTTPKFFWDASAESLGLGTTSHYDSSTKLTVAGRMNTSNGTATGSMNYGGGAAINMGALSNHPLQLMVNNSTKMILDTSGNVGIGTSSPSYTLDIASSGAILNMNSTNSNGIGTIYRNSGTAIGYVGSSKYIHSGTIGDFAIGTASTNNLTFGVNSSERMRIDSNGNVGIGTTSPDRPVHLSGSGIRNYFKAETTGSANSSESGFEIKTPSSNWLINSLGATDALIFYDLGNTSERMRLDSSGNVGIGTSTPSQALEVNGTSRLGATAAAGSMLDIFGDTTSANGVTLRSTYYGVGGYGPIKFETGGTERMRIDSSGNVGIGTSSPSDKLHVGGSGAFIRVDRSDGEAGITLMYNGSNSTRSNIATQTNGDLAIDTANTERMRIDSSGNILFNTTAVPSASSGGAAFDPNTNGRAVLKLATTNTGNQGLAEFFNPNGQVGGIVTNGSATAYNTSSDYRLKTNAQPMTGATDRLKQLNPVNFEWIADGTRVDGFLAHEAQAIVPEAVTGAKDAMRDEEYEVTPAVLDDDGNVVTEAVMGTRSVPDYQGIDQSKLVPLLTAALQEALTKIDALETRITALEG
jgi:hypothetical protein